MKYIQWASENFRNPKLALALKDESFAVGSHINFTMHMVVGQFFDIGLWIRNGKTGVPYDFDTSVSDFLHDCRLNDEEELLRIIGKFKQYQLTDFKYESDTGLLKLICPKLMDMTDRNFKETVSEYKKKSKIDDDDIEHLENYEWDKSTDSVPQITEDDTKLDNPKTQKLKSDNNDTSEDENISDKQRLKNRKLIKATLCKVGNGKDQLHSVGDEIDTMFD